MNGMTIGEMLRACRGEWQGAEETLTKAPSSIVTDSRQAGEGSLFLALRGEKTDGHKLSLIPHLTLPTTPYV